MTSDIDKPDEELIISPDSWTQRLDLDAIFGRPAPLEVDLGCGKGRFLKARATAFSGHNFIGIDRQRGRLEKVARKCVRSETTNVRLIQIEASYAVQRLLPPGSIHRIYVFFPDPWPKRRHHSRRLFSPGFMSSLYCALEEEGELHIATDHLPYYEHITALFGGDTRFMPCPVFTPSAEERTEFESTFIAQGLEIGRCSFARAPGSRSGS